MAGTMCQPPKVCLNHIHLGPRIPTPDPNPPEIMPEFADCETLNMKQKVQWSKLCLAHEPLASQMTDDDYHKFCNDYNHTYLEYKYPNKPSPESIKYVLRPSIFVRKTINKVSKSKNEPEFVICYRDVKDMIEALALLKHLPTVVLNKMHASLPPDCLTLKISSHQGYTFESEGLIPMSKGITNARKLWNGTSIFLRQDFLPLNSERTNWLFDESVTRKIINIPKDDDDEMAADSSQSFEPSSKDSKSFLSSQQNKKICNLPVVYNIVHLLQNYLGCTDRALLQLAFPEIVRRKCSKPMTSFCYFGVLHSDSLYEYFGVNRPQCLCSCTSIDMYCQGQSIANILKYTKADAELEMPVAFFNARGAFKEELDENPPERIVSCINWRTSDRFEDKVVDPLI